MINPYRTLNANLPERLPAKRTDLPADPRQLRVWMDGLPRANQQVYLQALLDALEGFRTQRLDGFARLELLEVLRPAVLEAVTLLSGRLQGSTFPLAGAKAKSAKQLVALQRDMALGYRMAVAEACAPAGKVPFLKGAQVTLALARAVYHHSRWLATSYFLYRSPDADAWAQLYALAAYAQSHKLDSKSIQDPAEKRPLTVALLQNQAVLLSLANPYRFNHRELDWLWALTRDVAALVELTPQRFAAAGALVLIDHDTPPGFVSRAPETDAGDVLWADLRKLNDLIRATVSHAGGTQEAQLRLSRDHHLTMPVDLLTRALEGWSQDASRGFARLDGGYVLDSVVGLTALHYQLAGERDFDRFLGDVRGVMASAMDRASWAAAPTDASQHGQTVEVTVQDQSLGGYRLRWGPEHGVRIRIGELVGVALPVEPGARDWAVGTVRWLRYDDDGAIEAGIDLVARRSHAVALRGMDESGGSQASLRALGLVGVLATAETDTGPMFLVDGLAGLDAMPQVEVAWQGDRWDASHGAEARTYTCPPLRARRRSGDYLVAAPTGG